MYGKLTTPVLRLALIQKALNLIKVYALQPTSLPLIHSTHSPPAPSPLSTPPRVKVKKFLKILSKKSRPNI